MHQSSSWRTRLRSAFISFSVAAAVFLGGFANAQVLEEVVVTAQKREQNVQDVGIAVTALSGDQISALGFGNAQNVVDMAPGVQIVQPNAVSSFSFAIRGVIQSDFADHQEPPVSVYVDEAYISQTSGAGFMLFDLERVEILRGPQGTLFGRNATGGLAQFITKKPSQEFDAYIQGKFGSWDQKGFEGAIGGGVTKNISARLSATMNQHDPYVRNRVGQDLNDGNEYAVRGQVLFEFSDDLRLLVNGRGSAMEIRTGGADYEAASINPVSGFGFELEDNVTNPIQLPGDPVAGTTPSVACPGCDYFGFDEPDEDIFTGSFNRIGHNDLHTWGGGGRIEWDFEKFTMTSISDWYHLDKDYLEDSDGGPFDHVNFFLANDVEQFSQELRFNGELERTRWVAGFYWLHIRGEYGTGFEAPSTLSSVAGGVVPADALVDAFGPGLPASHPAGAIGLNVTWKQDTDSYSLFGQVEYDLFPNLTAILGFRWIEEQKEQDYDQNFVIFNETIPGGRNRLKNPHLLVTAVGFDKRSAGTLATYNKGLWSAKAGLEWRVTDDTLAYFHWNRGVKGGGFNAALDSTLFPVQSFPFKEEVLKAYEVGVKHSMLEGKVRVNANLYYYDYEDFQAFIFEGLSQFVLNKDAVIYGGEVEFQGSPLRGLDFSGGVAFLNPTIEDAINFGQGALDRDPPRAPKWNVNGLARYQFKPVFKNTWWAGHFAVQADFNYRSDFSFILTNSAAGEQKGYVIGNTRGSYTTEDGRWEVALAVKNITDQDYTTQTFDLASAFGSIQRFIDRPRWVLGTVRFTW